MPTVIATCEGTLRQVFIDNQLQGVTDTPLSASIGDHFVDLGMPVDYLPPFQEITLGNGPEPTIVAFTPIDAFVDRATVRLVTSRKAAARARKARRKSKAKAKSKSKARTKAKAKSKPKAKTSRAKSRKKR